MTTNIETHLYCSVCSADVLNQHLAARARSSSGYSSAPQFIVVNAEEVAHQGGGVWQVPRAHVIASGHSLCMGHFIESHSTTAHS